MYENHFGLNRKPFQSATHDSEYFRSQAFEEVSSVVLHALRSDQGVAVISAPSGCGKTAALDALRRQLDGDARTVLLRGGAIGSVPEFQQALSRSLTHDQLEQPETNEHRWDLIERLQRAVDFWGPLVLLIDDAHLLDRAVFAELRTFLEEEFRGRKLIRLLIAGPLSLEETLAEPAMSDFALRIRTHAFLQSLRTPEAVAYLDHQLNCAGARIGGILDPSAVEAIVTASDGLPRCLNLLTDEAMVVAAEHECPTVMSAHVREALTRLQHLPVTWNVVAMTEPDLENPDTDVSGDCVVEIGGLSESCAGSVDSVIEIGAVEVGAIEIGGPATVDGMADADTRAEVSVDLEEGEAVDLEELIEVVDVVDEFDEEDAEQTFEFIEARWADDEIEAVEEPGNDLGHEQEFVFVEPTDSEIRGSLKEFELWEPAGTWDPEAGTVEPSKQPELAAVTTEATETLATPTPEILSLAPSNGSQTIPVHDRYTALEGGIEPVADSDGQTLVMAVADELQQILWPPLLEGVVPKESIPIVSDGPTRLADDLISVELAKGDASEKGEAESLAEEELQTLMLVHDGDAVPFDESGIRSESDAELTIDQIQDMLHSEIFERTPFAAEASLDDSGQVFEWVSGTPIAELADEFKPVESAEIESVDEPLVAAAPIPELVEADNDYQAAVLAKTEDRALRLVTDADESDFLFVQPKSEHRESPSAPSAVPKGSAAAEQSRFESSRFADLFTRLRQMQKDA